MTTSRYKSKVSTVALILVLTFATAVITCLPAVNIIAIEPPTALLLVMLNLTVIVQLSFNGFPSLMPVRLAQHSYFLKRY